MSSITEQKLERPVLGISTSLDPAVLSLTQIPYPTVHLTVTLTLHGSAQPLTLYTKGGVLDSSRYSHRRSPFRLVDPHLKESPPFAKIMCRFSLTSSKPRPLAIRPGRDLITVYPGRPFTKTFRFSGYETERFGPLSPGARLAGYFCLDGWPLTALKVGKKYEIATARSKDHSVFEWYELGDVDAAVKKHVGVVWRVLGLRRFKAPRKYLGTAGKDLEKDVEWREIDKASFTLVE